MYEAFSICLHVRAGPRTLPAVGQFREQQMRWAGRGKCLSNARALLPDRETSFRFISAGEDGQVQEMSSALVRLLETIRRFSVSGHHVMPSSCMRDDLPAFRTMRECAMTRKRCDYALNTVSSVVL